MYGTRVEHPRAAAFPFRYYSGVHPGIFFLFTIP
jgi:hypothetical protein